MIEISSDEEESRHSENIRRSERLHSRMSANQNHLNREHMSRPLRSYVSPLRRSTAAPNPHAFACMNANRSVSSSSNHRHPDESSSFSQHNPLKRPLRRSCFVPSVFFQSTNGRRDNIRSPELSSPYSADEAEPVARSHVNERRSTVSSVASEPESKDDIVEPKCKIRIKSEFKTEPAVSNDTVHQDTPDTKEDWQNINIKQE